MRHRETLTASPLQVACASDENFAAFSAALLYSLLSRHAGEHVCVHYLHPPQFSSATRQKLHRLVTRFGGTVAFHGIPDEWVAGLPAFHDVQGIPWFRVFLPTLLPDVDRVLYLDADTFVADRLDELWQAPLHGCHLAAVRNVMSAQMRMYLDSWGIPANDSYFNSGVLLMALDAWRRDDIMEKVLKVGRCGAGVLAFPDQDALNVVLQGSCHALHPRWNCMNCLTYWPAEARALLGETRVREALRQPGILHFEGPGRAKPWHYLSRHPYRQDYRRTLRSTGLDVPPLEGRTLENIFRKHLPQDTWRFLRYVRARLSPHKSLSD